MHAEFVAIGNELLLGDTLNTNAAWVGKALAGVGVACTRHTIVGDEQGEIVTAVREAIARAPIVIVSGGLGPTEDDLTREALAVALDRPLVRDERLARMLQDRFASFGRTMPERNLVQADVLDGARVIEPTWGTAPGLIVESNDAVVYVVPGVPDELIDMFGRTILEDIATRAGQGRIVSRVLHVVGVPESEVAERLRDVWTSLPSGIALAYLPSAGEVRVKLTARASDEAAAAAEIAPIAERVRRILGRAVIGTDADDLETTVAGALIARGWTLGAAESLTGGMFGARCTAIPGASEWFRGSIVAYDISVKSAVLGVPPELIERHGPVSTEVAVAMAAGARLQLGADIGVALTGVAGPTEQGATVGTVCLAAIGPDAEEVREVRLPGDRQRVRALAVTSSLILVAHVLGR